jgi:hypothetical protein
MELVDVDLAHPDELRKRWAAHAAVMAAIGYGDLSNANAKRWHYDDAGGNWAELVLIDGDRAVLFGHDHEYSETYFRDSATYFEEEETDLLAGAPDWWDDALPIDPDRWVGFVYGFENSTWKRAPYDVDDGFASLGHPAVSFDRLYDLVREFVSGRAEQAGIDFEPDEEVVRVLAERGTDLTAEDLQAVFGEFVPDIAAGVAAAKAFANRA